MYLTTTVSDPASFVAVIVYAVEELSVVGVPLIVPVVASMLMPAGRSLAVKAVTVEPK